MPDHSSAATRMDRIRERAAAHNEEIESIAWETPKALAAKWRVGVSTIYEIPREKLPYKEFGKGKRPRRRYRPEDVTAFEADDSSYARSA